MTFDPHSDATAGYHLFFLPQDALAERLSGIIRELAREYGAPAFAPHVTLLARIPEDAEDDLKERTKALAEEMRPLTLTLGKLESEDSYFRALYAEIAEQDALKSAHAQASAVFGMEPDPAYRGHLSLLYGNYPEARKTGTKARMALPEGISFVAGTLHLFKTPGKVETWSEVMSAALI